MKITRDKETQEITLVEIEADDLRRMVGVFLRKKHQMMALGWELHILFGDEAVNLEKGEENEAKIN